MSRRTLAAAAGAAAVAVALPAGTGHAAPGMAFGFSDSAPLWFGDGAVAPASAIGARSVRVTLRWPRGRRTVDARQDGWLAQADAASARHGVRLVVAVYGEPGALAPVDARAREDYCAFVGDAVARHPGVRDVVIWNEPNSATFWRPQFHPDGTSAAPAAYQALLARCYDVLHAAAPGVNVVGLATAPRGDDVRSHAPATFLRGVGAAYRASFRPRPILDTVAHHVYGDTFVERPWHRHPDSETIALGDWNKLMWNLALAFAGTAQPLPGECAHGRCVAIWYLESGFQTRVPADGARAYTGSETSSGTLPDWAGGVLAAADPDGPAPDQATQLVDAVRLAYCQPHVAVLHNFLLFDETRLEGWQSGVLFAGEAPKPSLFALVSAVAEVNAGTVDCEALPGGAPSPDYVPPDPPAGVSAGVVAAPLEVEVTWRQDGDADSYRVYRGGVFLAATASTGFRDATVVPGETYAYAVAAADDAGNVSARAPAAPVAVPLP